MMTNKQNKLKWECTTYDDKGNPQPCKNSSINEQLKHIIEEITSIMNYEEDVCGDNYNDWEKYDDIREILKDMIK